MKILYHFRTRGTGPEAVHIAGIANAFEQLGQAVTFISPTGVDPRKTAGTDPFAEPVKSGLLHKIAQKCPGFLFETVELAYNVTAWFRVTGELRQADYGLIYERHAFFLTATAILARRRGIPFVTEVNELVGDDRVRGHPWLAPLARLCDRMVFRRAALIVVVSPHLKRRIEAQGIPGDKIIVLPNAVEGRDFETPADGAAWRAQFGPDAVVLGFIGWFVAWHRLVELIEVFAALSRRHPNIKLMLVGEGSLRDELVAAVRRNGIEERVIFTGAVDHLKIPSCIAAMDVGIVPHSNEYRSPIKLFEYMGQGKAVVAPRTEPIAMVVTDGVNGIMFDPASTEGLSKSLETLILDESLRQRLGRQARLDVLRGHTWLHNAQVVLRRLSL